MKQKYTWFPGVYRLLTFFQTALESVKAEIAEASPPLDPAGSRSSTPGDPTARAVVAIERRAAGVVAWIRIIDDTFLSYGRRPGGELMRHLYVHRITIRKAAKHMHGSIATAHNWRIDILTHAALKGAERGVVQS